MMQTVQGLRIQRGSMEVNPWVSEPELIALLAPRSYERTRVSGGFWQGVWFAFLLIAPFYLLGICLWLR